MIPVIVLVVVEDEFMYDNFCESFWNVQIQNWADEKVMQNEMYVTWSFVIKSTLEDHFWRIHSCLNSQNLYYSIWKIWPLNFWIFGVNPKFQRHDKNQNPKPSSQNFKMCSFLFSERWYVMFCGWISNIFIKIKNHVFRQIFQTFRNRFKIENSNWSINVLETFSKICISSQSLWIHHIFQFLKFRAPCVVDPAIQFFSSH